VLLASPRSFCAGVERAIATVERLLDEHGAPVYVRRQIVHNTHVVARLRARGAVFVDELDAVPDGAPVVFSAHGVAPSVRDEAARRRLAVTDATCPLVAKVHAEARRFARAAATRSCSSGTPVTRRPRARWARPPARSCWSRPSPTSRRWPRRTRNGCPTSRRPPCR
jgi:LytB protein